MLFLKNLFKKSIDASNKNVPPDFSHLVKKKVRLIIGLKNYQ